MLGAANNLILIQTILTSSLGSAELVFGLGIASRVINTFNNLIKQAGLLNLDGQ